MPPILFAVVPLQQSQIAAQQFRGRIAGQGFETGIGVDHRALRILCVHEHDALGRALDQAPIHIRVKARHDSPSVSTSGGGGVRQGGDPRRRLLPMPVAVQIHRRLAAGAHPHQPRLRCRGGGIRPAALQDQFYGMPVIANGQDVATCGERQFGALDHIAEGGGSRHGQIVGENAAVKPQFAAQDPVDPALRQAGRQCIHGRKHHMGRHDSGDIIVDERAVGPDIRLQIGEFAPIHRQRNMRIGDHRPMAGKMLGDRRHPRLAHAEQGGHGQSGRGIRIAVEGAIADDLAHPIIQVDAGRKAEIHAHGAQFGGHQPAHRLGQREPVAPVLIVAPAQEARGRKAGKSLAKALHPPAFVIHRDQQMRRAHRRGSPP